MEDTVATPATRSRSKTIHQDMTASAQPATTAFVTLQEGMASSGGTTNDLSIAQQPSTFDQNADVPPHSLVVIAGDSFSLQCSSPVETIFQWIYRRLDSDTSVTVYNGIKMDNSFPSSARMSVSNCRDRMCTFRVRAPVLHDAGIFACKRRNFKEFWSITIFG